MYANALSWRTVFNEMITSELQTISRTVDQKLRYSPYDFSEADIVKLKKDTEEHCDKKIQKKGVEIFFNENNELDKCKLQDKLHKYASDYLNKIPFKNYKQMNKNCLELNFLKALEVWDTY
jgi:hypothetical protein